MVHDAEQTDGQAAAPDAGEPSANEKAAERSDRVANGLERLAYKFHDIGNWLMGFIR